MKEALNRAQLAFKKDEVPIGAVVVKNNEIIGYGQNRTIEKNSVFAHAEIEAISMASKKECRNSKPVLKDTFNRI